MIWEIQVSYKTSSYTLYLKGQIYRNRSKYAHNSCYRNKDIGTRLSLLLLGSSCHLLDKILWASYMCAALWGGQGYLSSFAFWESLWQTLTRKNCNLKAGHWNGLTWHGKTDLSISNFTVSKRRRTGGILKNNNEIRDMKYSLQVH